MTCYRCGSDGPTLQLDVAGGEIEVCASCAGTIHDGDPWEDTPGAGGVNGQETDSSGPWSERCPNGHTDFYYRTWGYQVDGVGPEFHCRTCGIEFDTVRHATEFSSETEETA